MSTALSRTLRPTRLALERASLTNSSARSFGTQSRPPLPSRQPVIETFSETSRPRPYYANHPPFRELPRTKSRWPFAIGALIVGGSAWAAFIIHVKNKEKLASSVFRSIVRAVKADPQLREVLGEVIRPQPEWWLNGDPYVSGHIGQLQGNIDVSFRIRGPKGSGTLYFTSIRREKGAPYTVLRFKVICDNGTVVDISDLPLTPV